MVSSDKTEAAFAAEIEACERFINNYRSVYDKLVNSDDTGEAVIFQIQNVTQKIESENQRLLDLKKEYQQFLKNALK
jgi:CHASE3 domain sensor protein